MDRIKALASAAAVFALLVGAFPAASQIEDVGGCVYNRVIYPEGTEVCQGGTLKRCESGGWGDIGMCDESEMPEPRPGGGDRAYPPE